MTIRREIIRTVKSALDNMPHARQVVSYVSSMQNPDGGFRGRSQVSDLYYTVFGAEILFAAGRDDFMEKLKTFLHNTAGPFNDLINLYSFVRLLADFLPELLNNRKNEFLDELARFRCSDNGFAVHTGTDWANIYGSFLALSLLQELGSQPVEKDDYMKFVQSLRLADGSYINHKQIPIGSAPATSAGMLIIHYITGQGDPDSAMWLKGQFLPEGGCKASPLSPEPDLLSTGVSLFALSQTKTEIGELRDAAADYIHSLEESGGFYSDSKKTQKDVEYTYYGLLGLGSLCQ